MRHQHLTHCYSSVSLIQFLTQFHRYLPIAYHYLRVMFRVLCVNICGVSRVLRTFHRVCALLLALNVGVGYAVHYTPQWAVHVQGGPQVADSIAAKHGFVNHGEVSAIFQPLFVSPHRQTVTQISSDFANVRRLYLPACPQCPCVKCCTKSSYRRYKTIGNQHKLSDTHAVVLKSLYRHCSVSLITLIINNEYRQNIRLQRRVTHNHNNGAGAIFCLLVGLCVLCSIDGT